MFFCIQLFLTSCGNNLDEVKAISIDKDGPDEVTTQVTMYFTDMGKSKLKLISPLVHRYVQAEDEMKLECPEGMELTFYDSLQQVESVLEAEYGVLESNIQYMHVKDSVIFTNNKGERLDTEELHIYFDKDSLYTDKFVKVATEFGVISGTGLVANSSFTKYELLNITDSYYYLNENKEDEQNAENE